MGLLRLRHNRLSSRMRIVIPLAVIFFLFGLRPVAEQFFLL